MKNSDTTKEKIFKLPFDYYRKLRKKSEYSFGKSTDENSTADLFQVNGVSVFLFELYYFFTDEVDVTLQWSKEQTRIKGEIYVSSYIKGYI